MITLTATGADQLAATAHAVADELRAGLDGLEAAQEVLGHIRPPRRTGRLAASVRAEATPGGGFAIVAGGPTAPYAAIVHARDPFLADPLDARAQAVADNYAQQLEQLLTDTLQGA